MNRTFGAFLVRAAVAAAQGGAEGRIPLLRPEAATCARGIPAAEAGLPRYNVHAIVETGIMSNTRHGAGAGRLCLLTAVAGGAAVGWKVKIS
ncbi:MAG: hypothetical protein Q8N47_14725 [Bryobacterales bacterium]|nr:hypothetical protein [Bryobacterales bacterium]